MTTSAERYTLIAIVLHWTIAILMMFMLFLGENLMARGNGSFYPSVHVSLGLLILVLSFARLVWRLANTPPALPATMKNWEVKVSYLTHGLFYLLMVGLPITGMMTFASHISRHPELLDASVFGLFGVPMLPDIGGLAGPMHGLGSKVGQLLVFLHVAAALKHQFWDKDGVLGRMSPH
jgi:cytochrome b561